ncbi:MAG TPA: superoxide dismutase [Candidatus Nitrosocosmicus sp.]|nr:superoxide dismutase [Candidatus Nitrosocosmicus sp.]
MFTLPELPYDYNALEPYIDEQTMHIHHDKHHATYVKNVNDFLQGNEELINMNINDLVMSLDKVPEDVRQKVRNNAGGHVNHSLFWRIMSPDKNAPSEGFMKELEKTFNSMDGFKEQFSQKAINRFGSGWAWLVLHNGTLELMDTINQDSPLMEGMKPILGIDVWEHAYYLKYQNRRPEYVEAFFNVINWKAVEEEYERNMSS